MEEKRKPIESLDDKKVFRKIRNDLRNIVNRIVSHFAPKDGVGNFRQQYYINNVCGAVLYFPDSCAPASWRTFVNNAHIEYFCHLTSKDRSKIDEYAAQMTENTNKAYLLMTRFMVCVLRQIADQVKFAAVERYRIDLNAIREYDHKEIDVLCNPMRREEPLWRFEHIIARIVGQFVSALIIDLNYYNVRRKDDTIFIMVTGQKKGMYNLWYESNGDWDDQVGE